MGIAGALQKRHCPRLDSARLCGTIVTVWERVPMTDRPDKSSDRRHDEPAGPDRMRFVLAFVGVVGALAIFAMNMGD